MPLTAHGTRSARFTANPASPASFALGVAIYVAAAATYFVLPIWRSFHQSLLGTALFAPDNILNAGILEWGYRTIRSGSLHVFDWPSGYPVRDTLAGTENLLGWQAFFFPARELGVGVVGAYNICVIVSFAVSAIGANLWARRCGLDRDGALVAGLVFAFVPVHVALLVQLQALAICWLPLGLVLFDRLMIERRWRDSVGLAATVSMASLSSLYFGVFLVLLLALWSALAVVTGRFTGFRHALGRLGVAVVLTALVLLPIALKYLQIRSTFGFNDSIGYAVDHSLGVADFFQVQRWLLLWHPTPLAARPGYSGVFPGFAFVALLLASWWWRPPSRVRAMLLAAAVVCALLSLGPRLKLFNYPTSIFGGIPMPGIVLGWIPGIRMPLRMLPCAFVFLSVLAGGGASAILARASRFRPAILAGMVLIALLDAFPAPSFIRNSVRLPPPLGISDAYVYLSRTPATQAVVELPARDSTGMTFPVQSRYVYGSVGHLQRVVSYNLSVTLPAADSLQLAAERLPDERARTFMVERGVGRLVVHRSLARAQYADRLTASLDSAGYRAAFRGTEAAVYWLDR